MRKKISAADRAFGARLAKLRDRSGKTQAEVAKSFGITVQAVSGWERGAVKPEVSKLIRLGGLYDAPVDDLLAHPASGSRTHRTGIPIIDSVQAGLWTPTSDPFPIGASDAVVNCDSKISEYAYALEVEGRSMEKRFYAGDIVIIEPRTLIDPAPRDFVVVKLEDRQEVTFKQFWRQKGQFYEIRALNEEEFDPILLNDDVPGEIIGVMVEHHSYRRSRK